MLPIGLWVIMKFIFISQLGFIFIFRNIRMLFDRITFCFVKTACVPFQNDAMKLSVMIQWTHFSLFSSIKIFISWKMNCFCGNSSLFCVHNDRVREREAEWGNEKSIDQYSMTEIATPQKKTNKKYSSNVHVCVRVHLLNELNYYHVFIW